MGLHCFVYKSNLCKHDYRYSYYDRYLFVVLVDTTKLLFVLCVWEPAVDWSEQEGVQGRVHRLITYCATVSIYLWPCSSCYLVLWSDWVTHVAGANRWMQNISWWSHCCEYDSKPQRSSKMMFMLTVACCMWVCQYRDLSQAVNMSLQLSASLRSCRVSPSFSRQTGLAVILRKCLNRQSSNVQHTFKVQILSVSLKLCTSISPLYLIINTLILYI